jgi:hypothetical protein
MENSQLELLKSISVAKYIMLIDSLKCIPRRIGGNQMRHSLAVFGICLDYVLYDSICLKLSLCHDLLEDHPNREYEYNKIKWQIREADEDGPAVLECVEEITIGYGENKEDYLKRLLTSKNDRVKIIKGADRIANFTDLNTDFTDMEKIEATCTHTQKYVIPMLESVTMYRYQAENMIIELKDLIKNRLNIIKNLGIKIQEPILD